MGAVGAHLKLDYLPATASGKALLEYVLRGVPVGDFLAAVVTNDLHEAVVRADPDNRVLLREYVGWLHNEAPTLCWRYPKAIALWAKVGGLEGFDRLPSATKDRFVTIATAHRKNAWSRKLNADDDFERTRECA